MLNILNIDYSNQYCYGSFNESCENNKLILNIKPSTIQLTNYKVEITKLDGTIYTSEVLTSNDGVIRYELSNDLFNVNGTIKARLLSNEANSDYIFIHCIEFETTDNICCKYSSDKDFMFMLCGKVNSIVELIYPIGTQIYNSNESFNPNSLYQGTIWEKKSKIKPYMIVGSKVVTSSSNYVLVHKLTEVQDLFKTTHGIESIDINKLGISFFNGDGGAVSAHFSSPTYQNGNIYCVYDKTVSGSVRVNFNYIYNVTEYYWERIS